jgi:octaprenyl-diphosphate synthase
MSQAATPSDLRTLSRLHDAAAHGPDPDRARARLVALRALVDGDVERLEAQLPSMCADAPRDVAAASRHLLHAGGKRVRPLLLLLSVRAARAHERGAISVHPERRDREAVPESKDAHPALPLAIAAELVHNATLLHDDVIDDGRTRRGAPAARVVWGNAVSVLGGDFLLTRALELVEQAGTPGALHALLGVIRRMVEGEALQLDRRGRLDADEKCYRDVVDAKTAALFAWCGRAGALAAGAREGSASVAALESYGFHLGRTFQIVDDVLDIAGDARIGKDLLADLREGKITLPVLYAMRDDASLARTLEIAASTEDDRQAAELAAVVAHSARRSGAVDRARAAAIAETVHACAALEPLAAGPYRDALSGIARELAERGI